MGDLKIGSMPQLELIVRGMKREQAGQPTRTRLPITPEILRRIHQHWKEMGRMGYCNVMSGYDPLLLWFLAVRGGGGTF